MSAVVLSSSGLSFDSFEKHDMLQKCGEVFLERQLGNLLYLCTLCDDRFKDVDFFLKHISDVHVSVESFIAFDPDESDEDASEKELLNNQAMIQIKEIELVKSEYLRSSDEDDSNHEEVFNIIDTADEALDIEVCKDSAPLEVEMKVEVEEPIIMEPEELSVDDKTEEGPENPIDIQVNPAIVNNLHPEDDVINAEQVENEIDATAEASDDEILRSKIKCKYCGQEFDYVKDLRKHDCGLKKGKKLHHCRECGKIFKKKSGLDIHLMTHSGKKPHKCDICGTAYACKQNLIVHVRRHTGEKPFKCNYCDRAFATSTERISHMRTHTGERPFVCDICGKAHTSSSQLTEHMHRHWDIRNYVCEICDKRFRNSYNLRMHRLTHEDAPRKFSCEHCMAAFKTHSNLVQHAKIHLKEKKYVCKICGRAFAQHPGLYSHMKSHAIFK